KSPTVTCSEPHPYTQHHKGEPKVGLDDNNATQKPAKASKGFTAEERAAIRERAKEEKESASMAVGERDLPEKSPGMAAPDRGIAVRLPALIKANAPALSSKTWYGMPAYARYGKIICFFQPAEKFKTRYATLGFNDSAKLDDGGIWPVAYAL